MTVSLPIPGPLVPARFLERPTQFTVRVTREPEGDVVTAHLPTPGRLRELLVEGAAVWIRHADDPQRETAWSCVMVQDPGGALVSLDTSLPNRLVHEALDNNALVELEGWHLEQSEATIGRSRFDFLLSTVSGEKMALEVKGVTMVKGGIAMFPDAPTDRGRRHVETLAALAGEPGWAATLLFVVQRIDANKLMAARHIDRAFAELLAEAARSGVRLMARRCQLTLQEAVLGIALPVDPALERF